MDASRNRVLELQSPTVSAPPSRIYFTKRSLLRTTRDARHVMTVLGPCRASDPPESRRVENGL
jgi:hypothetical protein